MSTVYKTYGLFFNNRVIDTGQVWKGCSGTNNDYTELAYFLHQIQHIENIAELYLPTINAVVNSNSGDNLISSGSSLAEIGIATTKLIGSNGVVQTISTADFRSILQEYEAFLQTPPLNGSRL
jgi:hypothetical protein